MQLARVIGTVVATHKDESIPAGTKLLVIQPIDGKGRDKGSPIVAADTVGAGFGERVFYARSKEGAMPLSNPDAIIDAGVIGIIDHLYRIDDDED